MALWRDQRFEVVISTKLQAELIDVLERPGIAPRVELQRKMALLRRLHEDAILTPGIMDTKGYLPDPADDFSISAALESDAEFIVTWDRRLLEQRSCQGVQIVTPDVFISLTVRAT
jgi:predicted nucleic acid-binding protein